MITPEKLAEAGSEHAHQTALFQAIALAVAWKPSPAMLECGVRVLPASARLAFAIKNARDGDNAVAGAKAQAEGVKAGVPDICLPVAVGRTSEAMEPADFEWHSCYIELKRPMFANRKDGGCSIEQVRWILQLRAQGHYVNIAFGWQMALRQVDAYLSGLPLSEFSAFDPDGP